MCKFGQNQFIPSGDRVQSSPFPAIFQQSKPLCDLEIGAEVTKF